MGMFLKGKDKNGDPIEHGEQSQIGYFNSVQRNENTEAIREFTREVRKLAEAISRLTPPNSKEK